MNVYLLVEGRRTERRLYPAWLKLLLPAFRQVDRFDAATDQCFFVFSGEGYPCLLQTHLPNAIRDCNKAGRYKCLIVCMDAEEEAVEHRRREVELAYSSCSEKLYDGELVAVIQTRCIETWLLGNRRMISAAPNTTSLDDCLRYFDVRTSDPELMGRRRRRTHAQFHGEYLQTAFKDKGMTYSKRDPGHAKEETYLQQLISRINDQPEHLRTFQFFLDQCQRISALSK